MVVFKSQSSFEKRPPSPFGKALHLAKMITDRDDDQSDLKKAMSGLDERGQKNLVWKVLEEVMELRAQLPALFATAYTARMIQVAHYGAALFKLIYGDGGVGLSGLKELGLAKAYATDRGRKGIRYRIGREAFQKAIALLQRDGKYEVANILQKPLLMAEKNRLIQDEKKRQRLAMTDVQAVADAVAEKAVETLPPTTETPTDPPVPAAPTVSKKKRGKR